MNCKSYTVQQKHLKFNKLPTPFPLAAKLSQYNIVIKRKQRRNVMSGQSLPQFTTIVCGIYLPEADSQSISTVSRSFPADSRL